MVLQVKDELVLEVRAAEDAGGGARSCTRYSSGMYARLGFAVAVHSNPEVLLVAEVLSVGDAFFEDKCVEKMHKFQRRGTTIVVVSYALDLVASFCGRAICWSTAGSCAKGRRGTWCESIRTRRTTGWRRMWGYYTALPAVGDACHRHTVVLSAVRDYGRANARL
jgi:ABC-type glutathione transport system ATPase component